MINGIIPALVVGGIFLILVIIQIIKTRKDLDEVMSRCDYAKTKNNAQDKGK